MTDHPDIGSDDQSFLDSVLDHALRSIEDGREIDPGALAAQRPHLQRAVRELVDIARQTAATRPQAREYPRVAGFEVIREIGRGAMGAVYLARQVNLGGREVALKVLPADSAGSRRSRERFRNEAFSIARLRHPNIVGVYDVVSDGASFAYAMEHVDGLTLQGVIDWITRSGGTRDGSLIGEALGLSSEKPWGSRYWRFAAWVGASVARALDAVHRAGLLHRDVKPSNIFLRRDGTPLLGDFGLVRDPEAELATETQQFVGTPAYASPEQLAGDHDRLDARSDVYSLGATLYHVLALRTPFAGRSAVAVLKAVEAAPPTSLRRISADIPEDLDTIVAKAMDPDPIRRYRSAGEFADDLERLLRGEPIAARPATAWYVLRRFAGRHPGLVGGVLATTAALVLGLAGVSVALHRAVEARSQADLNAARSRMSAYVADIQAAAASLRSDDAGLARRLLEGTPHDLRGWEWSYLSSQTDQSVGALASVPNGIQCLALSPDGARLAACDFRTLLVVDATRLTEIARVDAKALTGENIRSVAWSADARRLYVGSHARGIAVFDAESLARLPDLPLREGAHYAWISVRPNGWVAAGGEYRTAEGMRRVLTVHDPQSNRTVLDSDEPGTATSFSWVGDTPRLIAKDNTRAWMFDVETRTHTPLPFRIIGGGHGWDAIAASPDGTLLAVSNQEATQVWSTSDLTLRTVLNSTSPFKSHRLAFSPDGARLYCIQGARILGWDIASGRLIMRARGERGASHAGLAVSADGRTVITGHDDGALRQWATDTRSEGLDFQARDTAGVSADFTRVAFTQGGWPKDDDTSLVMVKDLATGVLRERFALGSTAGTTKGRMAYSPDGRYLLRAQELVRPPSEPRSRVYLKDLHTGATVESVDIADEIDQVLFVPACDRALVGAAHATLVLRLPDLTQLARHPIVEGSVNLGIGLSSDGSLYVRGRAVPSPARDGGYSNTALELRRTADGALVHEVAPTPDRAVLGAVFAPDRAHYFCRERREVDPGAPTEGREVIVARRLADAQPVASIAMPGLSAPALCTDATGTRVFAGLRDGTIRVIAFAPPLPGLAPEFHEVLTLVSDYWMDTPVISPDGRRLACLTVWPANRCVVWDAKPERERWEERRAWEVAPPAAPSPTPRGATSTPGMQNPGN